MYLTVTIDTEEDNWGEYDRASYSVENVGRIPRLQQVFAERGVRPTYLISHPVATSRLGIEVLGKYCDSGLCEIGAHPHPWNTPPLEEDRTGRNSYISNLPADLQYRKIKTLHDAITRNFGLAPRSYRSGRWGFSESVARSLIRLGYIVDSSVSPTVDWRESDGPDYSDWSIEPFVYQVAGSADGGSLLEVPATIEFVQRPRVFVNAVYQLVNRRMPRAQQVLAGLSKLGVLNRVGLTPEIHSVPQMIRLAAALLRRGTKVINMFFHSPSLIENCSPYVKTAGDVTSFIARIDTFLAFAQSAGIRFVTMSELGAVDIGASRVRVLSAT